MSKQRANLPFDTNHFSRLVNSKEKLSVKDTFLYIYQNNHWNAESSKSGAGSDNIQTEAIKRELPGLIEKFNIKTMLDLPCGDFNWLNNVTLNLQSYIGGDIVKEIIDTNIKLYQNPNRRFLELNIITDTLPDSDLLFCRDCLVHFSNEDIVKTLNNIKNNKTRYFCATSFINCEVNNNITTGDWRIINLTKSPFLLPEPIFIINEKCTEGEGTYNDKSLCLWKVEDL
ncbi:MAG: class I SAM-dependent methyltransferase [bacterium]